MVPAGQVALMVSARFGRDPPNISGGLHWRIYPDKPDAGGVYSIPLVVVAKHVNKFYVMVLSPVTSFVTDAVKQGVQVFMVSGRNQGPELSYLSLQPSLQALEDGDQAVMEITGGVVISF
jgi:polyhydroxyalkanoate synthase